MLQLSTGQKQQFKEQGYLVLPGALPQEAVAAALQTTNAVIGQCLKATWAEAEQREPKEPRPRVQPCGPDYSTESAHLNLVNEAPVRPLIESLLDNENNAPITHVQVASRFPSPPGTEVKAPNPHLDGWLNPVKIQPFSLLVGAVLSDIPQEYMGNFTVWPGTPNLFADYYNERTDEQLQQEAEARVLKTGIPPIELPEPVQITVRAGDLILVHYCVAHSVAPNVSPYVRYALFYRFGWNVNKTSPYEIMRQPWKHWNL
jgi:hypothetical protein